MSTRKANFITLDDLVDQLGVDVVRYFFIMRGANSHLDFDFDLESEKTTLWNRVFELMTKIECFFKLDQFSPTPYSFAKKKKRPDSFGLSLLAISQPLNNGLPSANQ